MNRTPAVVFTLIVVLAAGAGAALALGARRPAGAEGRARELQSLVGGLGFGPALDLERGASSFDPRLGTAGSSDWGPVPGAMYFCPFHAGSAEDSPPTGPGEQGAVDALPR
jgi:hypothetical protein